MKRILRNLNFNKIALFLGCIFIFISIILLIKTIIMEKELDEIIKEEAIITEQIKEME